MDTNFEAFWEEQLMKMRERAECISSIRTNLLLKITLVNMFVSSVSEYIECFHILDENMNKKINLYIRKALGHHKRVSIQTLVSWNPALSFSRKIQLPALTNIALLTQHSANHQVNSPLSTNQSCQIANNIITNLTNSTLISILHDNSNTKHNKTTNKIYNLLAYLIPPHPFQHLWLKMTHRTNLT
jgi:hypothetical protein